MSRAFTPLPGATANIDVSSSTGNVSLGFAGGPYPVRIFNNGTATAWINFGTSAVTASLTTGMPVGPGVTEVVTVPNYGAPAYVAAIAAGSTGKIYFTPGADGI
jgi:hypothetical protein